MQILELRSETDWLKAEIPQKAGRHTRRKGIKKAPNIEMLGAFKIGDDILSRKNQYHLR